MADRPSAEEIDALWDFEDPAHSERAFQTLLERVGAETETGAEGLTQIARAQGLQQRFEEAHRTLDRVEPFLGPHATRLRARYLLERGRVLNSSGDATTALPLFLHALGVALAAGEAFYAVDAAHMMAIACSGDDRLRWNRRGLVLAEESHNPRARRWRASLLNNLGWAHHDRGEFSEALGCFEEALQERVAQGNPSLTRHARWCVGRGLRSLGRATDALRIQEELLAEDERAGRADPDVYEELVECLTALGHTAEAEPYRRRLATLREPG